MLQDMISLPCSQNTIAGVVRKGLSGVRTALSRALSVAATLGACFLAGLHEPARGPLLDEKGCGRLDAMFHFSVDRQWFF